MVRVARSSTRNPGTRAFAVPACSRPRSRCRSGIARFGSVVGVYVLEGHMGGREPVILLDTIFPKPLAKIGKLTHHLYGGDAAYRLKQEMVLGVAVCACCTRSFQHPPVPHERRPSALLTLELLRRHAYPRWMCVRASRATTSRWCARWCNFTTHTPVEAGHDQFPYELALPVLGDFIDVGAAQVVRPGRKKKLT